MRSINPVAIAVFLVGLAALPAFGQTAPAGATPFVGSENCGICHQDIHDALAKSPHQRVETGGNPRSKAHEFKGAACEACHGNGQKHVEAPGADTIQNPAKLAPAAADKICLTCHLNQPTHAGRLQSSHAKNEVACTSCHKIHANGPQGLVTRRMDAINALCADCHLDVWTQFQRPNHHRLPEGAMSCVDCHNPHGSGLPQAMAQSFGANEPGCLNCHGDKRGPFTFEHAPVRFEGCAACHEPHGSANPRMLTRQEVRFVCLECHASLPSVRNANSALGVVPPAFHNLNLPRFQNCTICHQKIHGSYVDRDLLK